MPNSSSSKSHIKKSCSNRERDKNKSLASESGGSSQCDTPPLTDKDATTTSHGKFAGIGPESIQCMAEQVGVEINMEAATNLAEDLSYKLRQLINMVALHSEMKKKTRVDASDVNCCLQLSDTSPVVGAAAPHYVGVPDEDICFQVEHLQNVTECAMTSQSYVFAAAPTLTVEWITDERSLPPGAAISAPLHNYYTKIAKAILSLKQRGKAAAVQDLRTNARIGPIFPNLFNLAVLVLNDDNLKALNVPAKRPLQANVLDMMDALCCNPCALDTNIQQQFQRLFPVMVSNILSNGSLSEKMVAVLTKITRRWPAFASMGKEILHDYLSKGPRSQLSPQMMKCLCALGRRALVQCLAPLLDYLDEQTRPPRAHAALAAACLDAASCLLRPDDTAPLEDYVVTDYTVYELVGDAALPRRTHARELERVPVQPAAEPDAAEEPARPVGRRAPWLARLRRLPRRAPPPAPPAPPAPRAAVFEPTAARARRIELNVSSFRALPLRPRPPAPAPPAPPGPPAPPARRDGSRSNAGAVAAGGYLNRFKYKLAASHVMPVFGWYML